MKNKKRIATAMLVTMLFCPLTATAQTNDQAKAGGNVYQSEVNFKGERPISTLENVSDLSREVSVRYVHDSWFDLEQDGHDALKERVHGETSCHESITGKAVDAYTRARYENRDGKAYADSGRVWDHDDTFITGYSHAVSKWVAGDINFLVAHTYYGR